METAWNRVWNLLLWILKGGFSLMFLAFGISKLNPHDVSWAEIFAKIGIGQWFRYFTGGIEIGCAILLLIPTTAGASAALLAITMAGAVLTHLFILRDGYALIFPALPLTFLIVVAWSRRLKSDQSFRQLAEKSEQDLNTEN